MQVVAQEYDPAIPLAKLRAHPDNPNVGADEVVAASLEANGWFGVIMVQRSTCHVLAGHTRVRVAERAGAATVPGLWIDCDDDAALKILLVDNEAVRQGVYDNAKLLAALQGLGGLAGTGFDDARLAQLLRGTVRVERPRLADRFLIPPFDVLDARSGWWRERKAAWLAATGGHLATQGPRTAQAIDRPAGYDSTFYDQLEAARAAGRPDLRVTDFIADGYQPPAEGLRAGGTSVFDPVLCELAYRWYSPPGGVVIDPFAGGPVRGVVAAWLGRTYRGCDLSPDQVAANHVALEALVVGGLDVPLAAARWWQGDGLDWLGATQPASADLVFTCPPYYDLERYSEDPADLSAMTEAEYEAALGRMLGYAHRVLRDDRWCVIVAGDARARTPAGQLRDMRGAVIRAATAAGFVYANGAVYVTPIGALRITVGYMFEGKRTLGRTHQDVLVFAKGDRGRAAAACGPVQVHMPPPGEGEDQ